MNLNIAVSPLVPKSLMVNILSWNVKRLLPKNMPKWNTPETLPKRKSWRFGKELGPIITILWLSWRMCSLLDRWLTTTAMRLTTTSMDTNTKDLMILDSELEARSILNVSKILLNPETSRIKNPEIEKSKIIKIYGNYRITEINLVMNKCFIIVLIIRFLI